MPYEMIVQRSFTERLPDNGVRVREPGEHITDQAWIEALSPSPDDDEAIATSKGAIRASVVRFWVDDPAPEPAKPESDPAPAKASGKPAFSAPAAAPASSS